MATCSLGADPEAVTCPSDESSPITNRPNASSALVNTLGVLPARPARGLLAADASLRGVHEIGCGPTLTSGGSKPSPIASTAAERPTTSAGMTFVFSVSGQP